MKDSNSNWRICTNDIKKHSEKRIDDTMVNSIITIFGFSSSLKDNKRWWEMVFSTVAENPKESC